MEENLQEQTQPAAPQEDVALEEINTQESAQAAPHEENAHEVNLRQLRQAKADAEKEKARLERERQELADKLRQYEQTTQQPQQPQDEEPDYGDNDFVEGRVLKKEITGLKKQLEAFQQQQKITTDEEKLRRQYSDFDDVVNPENMELFKKKNPAMADIIARSQSSLFSRGEAAYRMIKELTHQVTDNHAQDRAKAHENMSKPRPLNSVSPQTGDGPLSMANAFANGLTDDVKKQLWKEMEEATKRL